MTDNEETQYKKMIEDPIPKLITSLAVPTVLSQLITTIYNTADTYFVAQIGTSATAAVGVVFSLMSIIQAVGFGLGSTETMLDYSCSYGKYILIGAPIMCSSFVLNNILRSEGHALYAMWGLCAGGILNMILDPIFIFGFNMGISGAALATILSQIVSFVILLSIFIGNKSIVKLGWKYISMNISDYLLIIKTGFPTICRQMLGSVSSALLNIKAAVYGDAAVGAITIANKIYMLVRNVILGIGQGFQPVAGYNYGAKNKKRVKEAFIFSCTVGTVICTIAALIIGFNASSVIDWFRKDDMEVIRIGTQTLYFACAVMPLMAYSTYVNQMYQCLGFSTQATFLASCRQGICFIPLVIILPEIIGVIGVEVSQSAADLITFIISLPFQIKFFKKQLS